MLDRFEAALLAIDRVEANRIAEQSFTGEGTFEAIEGLIVPALERLGDGWEAGTVALAQVYMAGVICEELVDRYLPSHSPGRVDSPRVAVATLDDFHLLGKRMVYAVVRAAGFEVLDLGRMDVDGLVDRLKQGDISVLLVSVLMLPSALRVQRLMSALPEGVVVGVGGAPFRLEPELWREVGAHGFGRSASDAVGLVEELSGRLP